jgi:hypothetical protein
MKIAIGAIIAVIVLFFAVPMIAGGTTTTCKALESQTVSNTATNVAGSSTGVVHNVINSVGQAGVTGQVASAEASQDHPNTPSGISCTADYWKSML